MFAFHVRWRVDRLFSLFAASKGPFSFSVGLPVDELLPIGAWTLSRVWIFQVADELNVFSAAWHRHRHWVWWVKKKKSSLALFRKFARKLMYWLYRLKFEKNRCQTKLKKVRHTHRIEFLLQSNHVRIAIFFFQLKNHISPFDNNDHDDNNWLYFFVWLSLFELSINWNSIMYMFASIKWFYIKEIFASKTLAAPGVVRGNNVLRREII